MSIRRFIDILRFPALPLMACAGIALADEPAAESPAQPAQNYVVLVSKQTMELPEWKQVADVLVEKRQAKLVVYQGSIEKSLPDIRKQDPRLMALVAPPGQIDRTTVNSLHRITRQIDDDPYGDCIWGIITGYTPADAMRIVKAGEPLTIKRAEGTTNFEWKRFSDSMVITDWGPFEVLEQKGYKEPKKESLPESPEGMAFKFADYWQKEKPQLVVTSSHATQYNLEMPFGKGVIVSYGNKYHILTIPQLGEYAKFLKGVLFEGNEDELKEYLDRTNPPVMEPNDEPKVWIASGNCLFGDTKKTANSMVVTALSAYGCNQFVGYTVPTWYGAGGWGALQLFFNNHDASSLAESWYLNNQFILSDTQKKYPKLMSVSFNAADMRDIQKNDIAFFKGISEANYGMGKDQMGLVHDRDVVAFYGDPAWVARLDEDHEQSPWHVEWSDPADLSKGLKITANKAQKGRFAVWFPARIKAAKAKLVSGKNETPLDEIGLLTNDFLLINELDLNKGATVEVVFE